MAEAEPEPRAAQSADAAASESSARWQAAEFRERRLQAAEAPLGASLPLRRAAAVAGRTKSVLGAAEAWAGPESPAAAECSAQKVEVALPVGRRLPEAAAAEPKDAEAP